MKKTLTLTGIITLVSILPIIIIFFLEEYSRNKKNAFNRIFPPHFLTMNKFFDLGLNSYYIAGLNKSLIYLGNYTAPAEITTLNYSLTNKKQFRLNIPEHPPLQVSTTTVSVDSPMVFMTDHFSRNMFTGILTERLQNSGKLDQNQFSDWFPISGTSAIVFGQDNALKQRVLLKKKLTENWTNTAKYILEKQGEGSFSVSGKLHYNGILKQFIFVYAFKNEFICLDTNLNLIYKSKTIDTNSIAKLKIATISSESVKTYSAPPLIVNAKSSVFNTQLFINSKLAADNENKDAFDSNDVIDIYDLKSTNYIYSFYLPRFKNEKVNNFAVINNTLLAIYSNYLVTYTMQ